MCQYSTMPVSKKGFQVKLFYMYFIVLQVNLCQIIHQSVAVNSIKFKEEMSRHNYVTPTSYLELLGIFSKLVGMKKMELNTSRNRLKTGLEKVF